MLRLVMGNAEDINYSVMIGNFKDRVMGYPYPINDHVRKLFFRFQI